MLRADGDVADVELQRVLALDTLGGQAANALGNIYNLQVMRACNLATLRAMVERERLQQGQISLLTERLVSMIEQGIPLASVLHIVSLRDVSADYFAIWVDWIDVALLHFNSRHGRPPHAGWPESAADETGAATEQGEGGAATEHAEGGAAILHDVEDV